MVEIADGAEDFVAARAGGDGAEGGDGDFEVTAGVDGEGEVGPYGEDVWWIRGSCCVCFGDG